jgi:hypothetical protein
MGQTESTIGTVLAEKTVDGTVYQVVKREDDPLNVVVLRAGDAILGGSYKEGLSIFAHNEALEAAAAIIGVGGRTYPSGEPLKRYLCIGLGTGHLASQLDKQGWMGRIAEIDDTVVELANDWFLMDRNSPVSITSGRALLAKCIESKTDVDTSDDLFDLIYIDVFGGSAGATLYTKEAFIACHSVLVAKQGLGVLALNIYAYVGGDTCRVVYRTLRSVFKYVRCFNLSNQESDLMNGIEPCDIVFYASVKPLEFISSSDDRITSLPIEAVEHDAKTLATWDQPVFEDDGVPAVFTDATVEVFHDLQEPVLENYKSALPHIYPYINWTATQT